MKQEKLQCAATIEVQTEADTVRIAERLAQLLPTRCLVALDGTLGAGKTRFVRAFARACGLNEKDVTSPTFTLWQTYHGTRLIHHLDAYRINDEDEFDALGVEECFHADAVTFVEWAARVENCLPTEDRLSIRLEVVSENQRRAYLATSSQAICEILQMLKTKGSCDS